MKNLHLLYCALLAWIYPTVLVADNYVIFNQIMYDSPLNEQVIEPPYSNGEFMELYNGSENAVSLLGWYITGESPTEHFDFPDISIASKGFLTIAFRHLDSPSFVLGSVFDLPTDNPDFHLLYQHNVILANNGETITLYNANDEIVDQIYYDGTSHKTKPDQLSADNEDGTPGNHCVSLHRTWVEFNENGLSVPGTAQFKTDFVTFDSCRLAETTFGEHSITGSQSLPSGENYILSVTPLDPTTRVSISNNGVSVSNGVRTQTSIMYYDGLGRPNEQITIGITPDKNDLVQTTSYEGLHRERQKWLPVPMQTEGQYVESSSFRTQAQDYYSDSRPYDEILYENSALERVIGNKQPGDTWAQHPTANTYSINSEADNVRIYTVLTNGVLKTDGNNYPSGTLYKYTSADEDGKYITTYIDKLGRTIMELRSGYRTYYVYDNAGRLRYVLPHIKLTKLANGEFAITDTTLQVAAYCYKYDDRGNIIYKRLPGCEPQYMVYDQAGHLILSQDGNQRLSHTWTLYTYDSIGRNLYTAELLSIMSHEYHLSYFADRWYVEHYGNNPSNTSLPGTGYASSIFSKSNLRLLTVNYYDDYDYLSRLSTPLRQAVRFAQESGYSIQHNNATGMLTGTRVYNLSEDNTYTATAYYYDTKGRIVQNRSVRSSDGYKTATSTEYLFDGSVAQQLTVQGTDSCYVREHYRYTYDHAGRAKQVYYQLNNEEEILLSAHSYDDIGRLAQKLLHNNTDTVAYSYDIRNMLTETQNKHFSERLYYADNPSATACYNGNISAARVSQADTSYTFYYTYDFQNRLVESQRDHRGQKRPCEWFQYDSRGNITALQRYNVAKLIDNLTLTYQKEGNQLLSVKDDETDSYKYEVIEYIDRHEATTDEPDMRYDTNGNLISDADRGISVIHYNILNLPDTIQFVNGNQIVNLYDATGHKSKTIVYTVPQTTVVPQYEIAQYSFEVDTIAYLVTAYDNNIETIYTRDDTLVRRINNGIGYSVANTYFHHHKDHLGNINVVVDSEADTLVQSTIFYASGVPMAQSFGRDKQPYLYNGKEFIEAHGLNEYDSQARMYYSPVMRTTTRDPHAENHYYQSPYSWCSNSPVNRIDPNGMDDEFDKKGNFIRHVDNGTDYVMIENANGEMQNLIEFSYSENDVSNRAMLANVATYYAHQIGLNQEIGVLDNPEGGEEAMFATKSRRVNVVVNKGLINSLTNTSNNIMCALVHEDDHVKKGTSGPIAEVEAIVKEINHPTWAYTTDMYKRATMNNLINNATAAKSSVYSTIEPIINTLKTVGIILDYDQESNTYSWNNLLNEVMIIAPRKQ